MKLYAFCINTPLGAFRRLGAAHGGKLVDINAAGKCMYEARGDFDAQATADFFLPADLKTFLERGERAWEALREVLAFASENPGAAYLHALDGVRLLAPIERPGILLDAMLYEAHLRHHRPNDIPDVYYQRPFWSSQCNNTVVGTGAPIIKPYFTKWLDFELELGFYIGKRGINIPEERAGEYIAGFTLFNDVSARDTQVEESKIRMGPTKGKWFAHSNIMGPCMVTPDEIPDYRALAMRAYVNGELVVEDSSGGLVHGIETLIAYASREAYLNPGDFIALGTTKDGTAIHSKLNRWLEVGDEVVLEAEPIGRLVNRVVASAVSTKEEEAAL